MATHQWPFVAAHGVRLAAILAMAATSFWTLSTVGSAAEIEPDACAGDEQLSFATN